MPKPKTLVGAALAKTAMPAAVREEIEGIRRDLDAQYREQFIKMTEAISRQASALDRIQRTLELVLEHSAPDLKGRIPGLSVAPDGSAPDLATIPGTIPADPIGAGYALTQQAIADALSCSSADISILLKGHPLKQKPEFAIVVRRGKTQEVVNYHRRTVDEILRLIDRPPSNASKDVVKALERIRRKRSPQGGG